MIRGAILIGGQSSRFGSPKHLLNIDGESVLARTTRLLTDALGEPPLTLGPNEDLRPGHGPLAGLEAGFLTSDAKHLLVVACDYPGLTDDVLARLRDAPEADVAMPEGHPLVARWHRRTLPAIQTALDEGRRSVMRLLDGLEVVHVDAPKAALHNVNTPEDLERFRSS